MENKAIAWPFQLRQLAVMIDSGVPVEAALRSLCQNTPKAKSKKANPKLQKAHSLVSRGTSLPDAFQRAGLVSDFDYTLLGTADAAGKISDGLNHISERRVDQLQRVASLKASLILPKALVVIGAMAGLLIRTASNQQSIEEAIVSVGAGVAWFFLLTYVAVVVIRADTRIWMSWFWPYPFVRKGIHWYRLGLEYFFYNSLLWQISAGVDASNATKGCHQLLRSKHFQQSVMSAANAMDQGMSMYEALMKEGLVLTRRLRQVLLISDHSGTHHASIEHELQLTRASLKQKSENFFKWAPRVFYVIALIVVSKLMAI